MNSSRSEDASFDEVDREFNLQEETGNYPSSTWAYLLPSLRQRAVHARLSPEHYRNLLFKAALVLRGIANATGRLREDSRTGAIFAISDLWSHATLRNVMGLDAVDLDMRKLANAFVEYIGQPAMAMPYLDWLFLDAYIYHVIFSCKRDVDEDRLGPWDTGKWMPRVQSMVADAVERERKRPLLLFTRMMLLHSLLKILPTVLVLMAGVALVHFGWSRTGTAVLVLLLSWRGLRILRWAWRYPRRRRAKRYLARLESAYALLGGTLVPIKELRRAVDDALLVWGERRVFGVDFWAVLDHVCEAHPISLVASPN